MKSRGSEYDVSNQINTTDPSAVVREVRRIFQKLYPAAPAAIVSRAFEDCARLYRGDYPGYYGCDTGYHDLQHVLDVTLAFARLMDGYERGLERREPIGERLFGFGIITALFHDIGYLRHRHDTRHRNGAEYTLRHVSRGARFLVPYMRDIGMPDLAPLAGPIIHFTGYEIPIERIQVPNRKFRMLGNMLGTADILAQMADRCYLEKCRDRLYPEFVEGGLATAGGSAHVRTRIALFSSPQDLINKTPSFYHTAKTRLTDQLGATYRYMKDHFGGRNLYLDEVGKNIDYAKRVAANGDLGLLRRIPPPLSADAARTLVYRVVPYATVKQPGDPVPAMSGAL